MSDIIIRVNGTGNAWPVPLGSEHPFYNKENPEELANVSFSIIQSKTPEISSSSIEWEVLVDAGHGLDFTAYSLAVDDKHGVNKVV